MSETSENPTPAPAPVRAARTLTGEVVSDKMDRTVVVMVERLEKHSLYKKYVRRSSKIHAHDENNECKIGDTIAIEQCRPMSKTKAWRLHSIIERAR